MQIRFAIEGDLQLSRVLEGLAANAQDWTPAFEMSGDYLLDVFSEQVFDTEGNAIDEQWDPLSKAYAARKEKMFPGKGILEATGTMRNSFWKRVDPTSLVIGNDTPYFPYHQSNQPRSKLPRRVMLKLTDELKAEVVRNFQSQLLEKLTS